jgi:hypothetical protein
MAGFKYNAVCNQAGAIVCDLEGKVDLDDLAIFDMLKEFAAWEGCRRMIYNGHTYFLFSWKLVPERLPFSRVKTRSPVKARYSKLCDVGLIAAHPDNVKAGQSWYKFGKLYGQFTNIDPSSEKLTRPSKETGPSLFQDRPRPGSETGPVPEKGRNDTTNLIQSIDSTNNEEAPDQDSVNTGEDSPPLSETPPLGPGTWAYHYWLPAFNDMFLQLQGGDENPERLDYVFDKKDFRDFQLIKGKLRKLYHKDFTRVRDATEDELLKAFVWLMKKATADKWLRENWRPSNLNTQFNSIISLKGKAWSGLQKRQEFTDYFTQKYGTYG